MGDAFENILGQPKVRDFLRTSVKNDHVTHAYLFTGPAGSNKLQAAYALAQALLCPKGGQGPRGGECGECENCTRAKRRSHPDIHYLQPEGANGYLVDQIREVVSDVSYAPIQADKKIYIIDRVDLLGVSAANAFLKTLEEPPDNVVMILLGRTRESVLPTIASRCQIVPFRHIPPEEAAGIVEQNTGAEAFLCRAAIEACSGSITKAIAFLRAQHNERVHFRSELLSTLGKLVTYNDWQVLSTAKDLVVKSKAPLDEVRVKQEDELAKNSDFLAKSAVRQIEAKNKRALSAQATESLHQTMAIISSWLRDIAIACSGETDLVINTDVMPDILSLSKQTDISRIADALSTVKRCEVALDYNVSPETCLDVVLLKVREVLNG